MNKFTRNFVFFIAAYLIFLAGPVCFSEDGTVKYDSRKDVKTSDARHTAETIGEAVTAANSEVSNQTAAENYRANFEALSDDSLSAYVSGITDKDEPIYGSNVVDEKIRPEYISYNSDGTINEMKDSDGVLLKYSYEYDSNCRISRVKVSRNLSSVSFSISAKGVQLLSTSDAGEDNDKSGDGTIDLDGKKWGLLVLCAVSDDPEDGLVALSNIEPPETENGKDTERIIIVLPPEADGVKRTAKKSKASGHKDNNEPAVSDNEKIIPDFDLEGLGKTMDKADNERNNAVAMFNRKSSKYYEAMGKELSEKNLINNDMARAFQDTPENREIIDSAVAEMYNKNDPAGTSKYGAMDIERMLREETLVPAMNDFKQEIETAHETIDDQVVDAVQKSEIALYCKMKKEKIDVVIKLPEHKTE